MCPSRRHRKSNSGLSDALIGLVFAACSGHATTAATVTVGGGGAGSGGCDETIAAQDPYDNAMNRARCDHADMLVHPQTWTLERVASPLNVVRFELRRDGKLDCTYDVMRDGRVERVAAP